MLSHAVIDFTSGLMVSGIVIDFTGEINPTVTLDSSFYVNTWYSEITWIHVNSCMRTWIGEWTIDQDFLHVFQSIYK